MARNKLAPEDLNLDPAEIARIESIISKHSVPLSEEICDFLKGDTQEVRQRYHNIAFGDSGYSDGITCRLTINFTAWDISDDS